MKILVLIILCFTLFSAKAQENTKNAGDSIRQTKAVRPLRLIDGGILGPGLFFSVNYETRFKPLNKGLGFRAGIGYAFGATIPISINYLIGNNNKRSFLELGTGITCYIPSGQGLDLLDQPFISPNTYVMYRYQALKSPNTFRIGISQINVNGNFISFYPSLSLGHILNRRN